MKSQAMNRICKVEFVKMTDTVANNSEPKIQMRGLIEENGQCISFKAQGCLDDVLKILKESKPQLRSFRATLVWENYECEKDVGKESTHDDPREPLPLESR